MKIYRNKTFNIAITTDVFREILARSLWRQTKLIQHQTLFMLNLCHSIEPQPKLNH